MFKNDTGKRGNNRADMFSCPDKQKVILAQESKTQLIVGLEDKLGVKFNLEDTISRFEYHSVNHNGFFIRIGGIVGSERQSILILSNKNQKVIYEGTTDRDATYYCKLMDASMKGTKRG